MTKLKVLDLFSGIGGFSLGLERTGGFETVAFCEIDPFARKVLKKHWSAIPIFEDVRTLKGEQVSKANVITGGFPCQDISVAGARAGIEEHTRSGLWSEIIRLAGELRPLIIIVENVANLLAGPTENPGKWFSRVLGDLAALGFDAEWHSIPASAFGAPHVRDRVWIVAYSRSTGLDGLRIAERIQAEISKLGDKALANAEEITRIHGLFDKGLCAFTDGMPNGLEWSGQQWPETEPLLCRVDDGIPDRVGRTGACGNAVVPIIPETIGNAILASMAA